MKKIIFIVALFFSLSASAQTLNWTMGGLSGSPTPRDAARKYFCDGSSQTNKIAPCRSAVYVTYVTDIQYTSNNSAYSYIDNWGYNINVAAGTHTGSITRPAGSCTLPNVFDQPTGTCLPPPGPVCTAGKTYEITVRAGYANDSEGNPTNYGGCAVDVVKIIKCYSEGVDSTGKTPTYCTFQIKETGIAAPSGATVPVDDVPSADAKTEQVPPFNPAQGQGCPAGTVSLGIDSTGGSICGGSGTSPTAPTKTEVKEPATTVTNPDGSTDRVDISHRTNSDGSITTTTKTTTTGADGKVTVKEVPVTGPKPAASGGGAGVSDAKDEDKTDLCKLHPELNVCKNSQVSAGSCSGGVDSTSCTGDAIQCAILREQKRQWCELNKENPMSTLGSQVLSGNDPLKSTLPTKDNGITLAMPSSLDSSGWLGNGACFPDKSFTIQGHQITISFVKACEPLLAFRYILFVIALLASLKVVGGVMIKS